MWRRVFWYAQITLDLSTDCVTFIFTARQSQYGRLLDAEHVLTSSETSSLFAIRYDVNEFDDSKLQLDPCKKIKCYVATNWQGMTYEDGGTTRRSSATLTINHQTTWHHITRRQYSHYRENLKSRSAKSPSLPGYNFLFPYVGIICMRRAQRTAQCYVNVVAADLLTNLWQWEDRRRNKRPQRAARCDTT